MLVKMRQRARSLDAFSHLYRDFQYRLISTYTFSESSCHSESNDMRQGYVLINRLGCRAPWRVRWRHPHVRGRKKFVLSSAALHPRYSYSGGSPALGTTGKFWYTSIENGTPGQVLDYNFTFTKCGALCKVGDGIFRTCLRNWESAQAHQCLCFESNCETNVCFKTLL